MNISLLHLPGTRPSLQTTPRPPTMILLDKTVYQTDINTYIECSCRTVLINSCTNFTWSYLSQPPLKTSFIEEVNECNNKSGYFQLLSRPNVLVICQLRFAVQTGLYECTAKHRYGFVSRMMKLNILGMVLSLRL